MTAEELLAWRRRLGYSEVRAAFEMRVPAQSYRNWEDGRAAVPKLAVTVTRFIELYGPLPAED